MKGVCQSCRLQKYEVHGVSSNLIPSINLIMCKTCIRKGFEPRHIIILAARSGSMLEASKYIVNRLYSGDRILAEDVIKIN